MPRALPVVTMTFPAGTNSTAEAVAAANVNAKTSTTALNHFLLLILRSPLLK